MDIRKKITHTIDGKLITFCGKPSASKLAKDILAIPELTEALSLLELKKQGKLVKLADNQEFPDQYYTRESHEFVVAQSVLDSVVNANFKRVETL